MLLFVVAACEAPVVTRPASSHRPLLVISVDGLDHRYLRDADKLGLKIANLRRLMREGEWTDGVIGVFPTVTWPSHTTMITGVAPYQHGILNNRRPQAEGGEYYWNVELLRVKTLWHATRAAGLKSAAITWPVTVNATIDFNLPEYFARRDGGGMDLSSINAKGTPGLVEKIAKAEPSFMQEWMDDRTRTLATVYLLKNEKPDLTLLHLVDLDAEAHHYGPFTSEANAKLEFIDELIGQIMAAVPPGMAVALVSDHGFERADHAIDLNAALVAEGIRGQIELSYGAAATEDENAAAWLRKAAQEGRYGVGREIPKEELLRYTPHWSQAKVAFETAPHYIFRTSEKGEIESRPAEPGVHGLWPERDDYRSSLILWGQGIVAERKPTASMLTIAPRLAAIMGLEFKPGETTTASGSGTKP